MNRLTWVDSELHPRGGLNHLYRAFPLGFLWLIILLCLVLKISQGPPLCSRVKMDSTEEASGQVYSNYYEMMPPPF